MKRAFKKIETYATLCMESIRATRLIRGSSELFWKILDVVSGIQISVDALVAANDLVKSRKAVYLIGAVLLTLFAITFPDRIPSILSSSQIDTTTVLERTHAFVKAIKKLLPAF